MNDPKLTPLEIIGIVIISIICLAAIAWCIVYLFRNLTSLSSKFLSSDVIKDELEHIKKVRETEREIELAELNVNFV